MSIACFLFREGVKDGGWWCSVFMGQCCKGAISTLLIADRRFVSVFGLGLGYAAFTMCHEGALHVL